MLTNCLRSWEDPCEIQMATTGVRQRYDVTHKLQTKTSSYVQQLHRKFVLVFFSLISTPCISIWQICQGGKIPEKYFLKELSSEERMKTITVLQGNNYTIPYHIKVPNSIIRCVNKTSSDCSAPTHLRLLYKHLTADIIVKTKFFTADGSSKRKRMT